jgi:predicted Rossmann fold nucleotide-binding protein DprA/Smf involved in DNA uptake
MGRNKLIYALSDLAVVVASAAGSGGTWAGAIEALKAGWVPVFVRNSEPVPPGNLQLIAMGGVPLDQPGALAANASEAGPPLTEHRIAEDRAAYQQQSLNLLD